MQTFIPIINVDGHKTKNKPIKDKQKPLLILVTRKKEKMMIYIVLINL
jgi:hypothetical protein